MDENSKKATMPKLTFHECTMIIQRYRNSVHILRELDADNVADGCAPEHEVRIKQFLDLIEKLQEMRANADS